MPLDGQDRGGVHPCREGLDQAVVGPGLDGQALSQPVDALVVDRVDPDAPRAQGAGEDAARGQVDFVTET